MPRVLFVCIKTPWVKNEKVWNFDFADESIQTLLIFPKFKTSNIVFMFRKISKKEGVCQQTIADTKWKKLWRATRRCIKLILLTIGSLQYSVRRRSRRTFSTHFEIFRRRVNGVVIYFFNSDFEFFDDASEFSVRFFYVVFYFLLKVHVNFSSVFYRDYNIVT